MTETKSALIIANYLYEHPDLRQLAAPAQDAESLARVLENPAIGGFHVRTLINEPSHRVSLEIESFFDNRKRDDLLLLYFSGHGIKDFDGQLYFATVDTQLVHYNVRRATAVGADFVNQVMSRSRSRRQILLLDCCYSGAFKQGMLAKGDKRVGAHHQLEGQGRVVLTASDALQYSFEGGQPNGEGISSVFTQILVSGLETGEADLDRDGLYSLDEVYDYVYARVLDELPEQKPMKMGFVEGKIFLGKNPHPPDLLQPDKTAAVASSAEPLVSKRAATRGPHRTMWLLLTFILVGISLPVYLRYRTRISPSHPPIAFVNGIPSPDQKAYIAVLPFEYAPDSSLDYVAEGLSAGLAARLSNFRTLYVSPGGAVKKEVGAPKGADRESIARRLGVNLLIEGRIEQSGGTLKMVLSVYDVVHARVLDTGELTGDRWELAEFEGQIYDRVAKQTHLQDSEGSFRAGMNPAGNNQAYDRYLQARHTELRQQDSKDLQAAIGLYLAAINSEHTFSLAHVALARCYLSQFRLSKDPRLLQGATVAAEQAVQLDDDSQDAHEILAEVYKSANNMGKSLTELNRAVELEPNSDELYHRLGDTYRDGGHKTEAVEAYQKAVNANPYYWSNHNTLGGAYFRFGDEEKALQEFQKVSELAPDNAIGYQNIGAVYFRLGKWSDSIAAFQKSLEIQPDATIYSDIGTAYFFLKRYDDSIKMFERSLQLNGSGDEQLWGNLADAYRARGQTEKAQAAYKRAIAIARVSGSAQSAGTLGDMSLYYAKIGDQAQAVHYIRLARAKDPSALQILYSEGLVYVLLGQPSKAMPVFREAVAKGYSRQEIWEDPDNVQMRSLPEFAKLAGMSATK